MKNLNQISQQIPNDPLSGLKDIHLPPQPGWWPPAWGWWLVLVLVLAILYFLLQRWFRRQRRLKPIKLALNELKTFDFTVTDPTSRQLLLQQVSALIRRFSLAFFKDKEIAELCGALWLDFLCEKSGPVDRVELRKTLAPLLQGPYAPTCDVDLKALKKRLTNWFENLRRQKYRPDSSKQKRQAQAKGEKS